MKEKWQSLDYMMYKPGKKKGGITEHLNEPPTTFSIRKTTCPVGQVDFMLVVSEVVSQRCFCKKVS